MRSSSSPRRLLFVGGLVVFAASCLLTGCYCASQDAWEDGRTMGPTVLRIADDVELTVPEGYEAWTTDEPHSRVDVFRSSDSLELVMDVTVLPSEVPSETLSDLRRRVALEPSPAGLESWEWGVVQESVGERLLIAQAARSVADGVVLVNVYRAALEGSDDSAAEVITRFLRGARP